ncbi:CD209 antigen-like protein A [Liparis tanakae]|uniref:CD209 antigen-like protein A n=1 Tax=Liparis tanakae TaxID=230148 RepID=A0A4Z2GIS8_9TELE|nr:CD209 antigen-like protein A [Liparis tanakae]
MEDLYANAEYNKSEVSCRPLTPRTGSRPRRAALLSLGLLSVLLLVGLVGLAVHCHNLSTIKDRLTERLRASDLLNSSLTRLTEEMDRLQRWSKQKKMCPEGWKTLSGSCYFVSSKSASWEKSREDCREKGADLVIINSLEEQKFLSGVVTGRTWIGLSDADAEGSWRWIDGTPLTQAYWSVAPDNGGGEASCGEEDCAEIVYFRKAELNWNDLRCTDSMLWIYVHEVEGRVTPDPVGLVHAHQPVFADCFGQQGALQSLPQHLLHDAPQVQAVRTPVAALEPSGGGSRHCGLWIIGPSWCSGAVGGRRPGARTETSGRAAGGTGSRGLGSQSRDPVMSQAAVEGRGPRARTETSGRAAGGTGTSEISTITFTREALRGPEDRTVKRMKEPEGLTRSSLQAEDVLKRQEVLLHVPLSSETTGRSHIFLDDRRLHRRLRVLGSRAPRQELDPTSGGIRQLPPQVTKITRGEEDLLHSRRIRAAT